MGALCIIFHFYILKAGTAHHEIYEQTLAAIDSPLSRAIGETLCVKDDVCTEEHLATIVDRVSSTVRE